MARALLLIPQPCFILFRPRSPLMGLGMTYCNYYSEQIMTQQKVLHACNSNSGMLLIPPSSSQFVLSPGHHPQICPDSAKSKHKQSYRLPVCKSLAFLSLDLDLPIRLHPKVVQTPPTCHCPNFSCTSHGIARLPSLQNTQFHKPCHPGVLSEPTLTTELIIFRHLGFPRCLLRA